MRDHVTLYLNGEPCRVAGDDALLSLADWLRERRHLTGTKVVCAEGDCGSCGVLVGRIDDDAGDALRYAAIASCIARVFQLDGAHVVTVEGLGDAERPTPIQAAMARCHGAQCGFCTPGFVVALHQMAEDGVAPTRENATRALVGNLCRCTGYDAILRAAVEADHAAVTPLARRYASRAMIDGLRAATGDDVVIETPARRVYMPATLAAALAFRAAHPHATVVSGGTDWGVLVNKRARDVGPAVLALGDVRELGGIAVTEGALRVGATATLTELETVAHDAIPPLGEFLKWFGSPPIKNAATLAGNLATGSPIGDSLPALMALDAEVELASAHSLPGARGSAAEGADGPTRRRVPLADFYTGYRANVMRPDELIVAVHVPRLRPGETLTLHKVSKRRDLDISAVSAALFLRREGGTIVDVRIALGGVAPTVTRLAAAEDALRGGPLALDRFEAAAAIVRRDVTPIDDVRGSADYRRAVAGNLLLRAYHELAGTDDRAADVNGAAHANGVHR